MKESRFRLLEIFRDNEAQGLGQDINFEFLCLGDVAVKAAVNRFAGFDGYRFSLVIDDEFLQLFLIQMLAAFIEFDEFQKFDSGDFPDDNDIQQSVGDRSMGCAVKTASVADGVGHSAKHTLAVEDLFSVQGNP